MARAHAPVCICVGEYIDNFIYKFITDRMFSAQKYTLICLLGLLLFRYYNFVINNKCYNKLCKQKTSNVLIKQYIETEKIIMS